MSAVQKKIKDLSIQEDQHASVLLRTLDDDVILELRSCYDYVENYDYIVKMLKQFYGDDTSPFGLCTSLLNVKQKPGQSIRDFVSEIRVTTMRLFPDKDIDEREKILIMSFIEGLRNYKHSIILRQHQPATLNDAYNLVKNEKDVEQPFMMQINGEAQSEIARLSDKLDMALKKIQELESKLSRMFVTPKRPFNSSKIICHLCNKPGHIKRDCKSRPSCQICLKKNHKTEDCFFKDSRNKNVRNVDAESVKSFSTSEILERGDSINEDDVGNEIFNDAYVVNDKSKSVAVTDYKKEKRYPQEIINWYNYISGQGSRPRKPITKEGNESEQQQRLPHLWNRKNRGDQSNEKYPPTLISESRGEKAANKPVVPALVEGKIQKNVFIDSGCECNIIDYTFLKSVAKVSPNVKLLKAEGGSLSCANGSPIKVVGYTVLNIKIGFKSMQMKFAVVESIFPNVLIGIRSMKAEKICIILAWDCVKIEGSSIPFVSKVETSALN